MRTEMDCLVLENFILEKTDQPDRDDDQSWKDEFQLDRALSTGHATIPAIDRAGLRDFGLLMAAVIAVLFGIVLPWLFDRSWPLWPWVLAAPFAVTALLSPLLLRSVYRGWMRVALLLNRVMTPVILGVVFFLVFTPVSLILSLLGKDAMRRRVDPAAATYRIDKRGTQMGDMKRPF